MHPNGLMESLECEALVLNAYDSVPTHIPFSHYIVTSRTNDSMAFARFAICNTFSLTVSLLYF